MVVTGMDRYRVLIAIMVTINALHVGELVVSQMSSTIAQLGVHPVWARAGSAALPVIIAFMYDATAVVDMVNTSAIHAARRAL